MTMGRRKKGAPVHGWIVLDKPKGVTSAQAVAIVKRVFDAQKAGHAGTLDPMATGLLAVALGEATKTVAFAMDAEKTYRFTARWGEARDSDDAEGTITATSNQRPDAKAIQAAMAGFVGMIQQTPPAYSAVKVDGERAYDLAREGEAVNLEARTVFVKSARLLAQPDIDHAEFEMHCGKGTYVRAWVRDLGLALGTLGHVSALRRTRVGGFCVEQAIGLETLRGFMHSPAAFEHSTEDQCREVVLKKGLKSCSDLEYNWLGTDDQGRDVVARLIYGFRISVLFGLTLTIVSSIIGIAAGGVQGYFGGWVDLGFQRLIEVWNAIPSLYLLLILSSVLVPGFFVLLGILLLFSWVSLVGLVRAEFLRGRNFEYIMAARALGVSNAVIMFRHLLPNAMVATMTFLPFIVSSSVMTLTALDFLGFGLPPGSPSLGELLSQGKANVQAPWLGFTGFFAVAIMLSLLIFIGEAVRDAFDPRKSFR